MNTSGKSPFTGNRDRTTRISPRRHVESMGLPATSSYDSSEFPVLLRMPDVSRPSLATESEEKVDRKRDERPGSTAVDGATVDGATARSPRPSRRTRHHQVAGGSGGSPTNNAKEDRFTGSASVRFWSTIPPKVAAGGMLLAVIGLCFVLLHGSHPATPATNVGTEWSGSSPPGSADKMAATPTNPPAMVPSVAPQEWQTGRSSVAAKPVAPQFSSPTPASRQSLEKNLEKIPEPLRNWPESSGTQFLTAPDANDDATPVQGWPVELPATSQEQGALFNAPLESAQHPTLPAIRTSQYASRPGAVASVPQPGLVDSPRLKGTIEIPPPTKIYRQ